jgi:Pyruvate/2-oxoacid:ferredoxin oxidoreductase delta subunit
MDAGLRLDCTRVRFQAGAGGGDFRLEALDGGEFSFRADAILSSIGQDPELSIFGDQLAAQAGLLAADRGGATGTAGVWAGGDVVSQARYFTEAVGMGQRAAHAIHRSLLGEDAAADSRAEPAVGLASIATWYHPTAARAVAPRRFPSERMIDGLEVQLGLDIERALAEAERCFSCGTCVSCDNCAIVCPDLAVRRVEGGGYEVLADYCKGCGLCVRECPTGSMTMVEERR